MIPVRMFSGGVRKTTLMSDFSLRRFRRPAFSVEPLPKNRGESFSRRNTREHGASIVKMALDEWVLNRSSNGG